jgi:hypothetical protein
MKVNARAMRVRTFCQPDSVIAKQIVDAQSLFNLLGAPDSQQVALQQVAQFFKVIVEREQHRGAQLLREQQRLTSVDTAMAAAGLDWPMRGNAQGLGSFAARGL